MMRQYFARVLAPIGLLGAACVSSPSDTRTMVRFAIPEGATRVAVLGTADPSADPPPSDPVGRPRRPVALALWSRSPDRLTLIDAPAGTVRSIDSLLLPPGFRADAPHPVDRVLLTGAGPAQVAGLRELASTLPEDAAVEVVTPPGTADDLLGDAGLGGGRLTFRVPSHGERIELSPTSIATAFHVPLADGTTALGWGVEGAERRLLHLPRLGPLESLSPPLLELVEPAQLVLLDGRRYRDVGPASAGDGGPPITVLLTALDGVPVETHAVYFTNLRPGNPLLDLASREARLLETAHRSLALDGTEWWL